MIQITELAAVNEFILVLNRWCLDQMASLSVINKVWRVNQEFQKQDVSWNTNSDSQAI